MGYKTRISPAGPDRGRDIIASPDGFGFQNPRILVEVKHRKGQMGAPQVRSFAGGLRPNDNGLYVSTGGFSREARYEADRANQNLTLIDADDLGNAIIEHYDQMDLETRTLLPLKKSTGQSDSLYRPDETPGDDPHMNPAIILPVLPDSLQATQARQLFAQYGNFLRRTQACDTFDFSQYERETRTLPTPYSSAQGEVLLALIDSTPAACIAYRAHSLAGIEDIPAHTAEIKRLFVAPPYRNQGLARQLVADALTRAIAHLFTRIVLDTDVVHMPGALALYRSFGFHEYAPQQGNIAFLDLTLKGAATLRRISSRGLSHNEGLL